MGKTAQGTLALRAPFLMGFSVFRYRPVLFQGGRPVIHERALEIASSVGDITHSDKGVVLRRTELKTDGIGMLRFFPLGDKLNRRGIFETDPLSLEGERIRHLLFDERLHGDLSRRHLITPEAAGSGHIGEMPLSREGETPQKVDGDVRSGQTLCREEGDHPSEIKSRPEGSQRMGRAGAHGPFEDGKKRGHCHFILLYAHGWINSVRK